MSLQLYIWRQLIYAIQQTLTYKQGNMRNVGWVEERNPTYINILL
jgi:hypothetical protein